MEQTEKTTPAPWREIYEGGSEEAEQTAFLSLARDILNIQTLNKERAWCDQALRTLHAKMIVGITNARLTVNRDLPERFRVDYFEPGVSLQATLRLSNASGVPQVDSAPDMRGMALRIATASGVPHDLLMTNFPVSHARTARQFVDFARIASGERATLLERLIEHFGHDEATRMLANLKQGVRPCVSLALERFWSRGAILWGQAGPVRFNIRPSQVDNSSVGPPSEGAEALRDDFAARLRQGALTYHLALQEFVNETVTPIEDGAVEWLESVAPSLDVATVVIPQQDLTIGEVARSRLVDGMAFNPWNASAAFRPLGNLMRARKVVYTASAEGWLKR
jgi:Catalase